MMRGVKQRLEMKERNKDMTKKHYELVEICGYDEYLMATFNELHTTPQAIVNADYCLMCLSDRKKTIVELREMVDEYNYDVIAEMDYEKEVKNWFLKNAEREDENND